MTLGRIAWLTACLATSQLIATSAHAADMQAPETPAATPEMAQPPPVATPPTPPAWDVPPPPPRPVAAGPVVHVNSPNPATELQLNGPNGWDTACTAPCNQVLKPGGLYRVNGSGIRASQPFNVPNGGHLRLDVSPGSAPRYWAGMGIALGGLGTMGYGLIWLGLASETSNNCSVYDTYCSNSSSDAARGVGTAFLLIGGVAAVVGLIMWLQNGTQVEMR
jgi:hypothetical protein